MPPTGMRSSSSWPASARGSSGTWRGGRRRRGPTSSTRPTRWRRSTCSTLSRGLDQPVRVILAGSAGERGPVPAADLPVGEDWPARPADPYGLSKYLASAAGLAARGTARRGRRAGSSTRSARACRGRRRWGGSPGCWRRATAGPLTLTVGDLAARRDFVGMPATSPEPCSRWPSVAPRGGSTTSGPVSRNRSAPGSTA